MVIDKKLESDTVCFKKDILRNDTLPVLPPGIHYLLKALADENIDFQQLEQIIGQFPSITARLLFLSNSAWAAPRVPVTSLKVACSRLGLTLVRSVSMALAVSSPFDPARCPGFNAERFWCTALLVADGAMLLAPYTDSNKELDDQTLHTAGLLHNLGLLWLADKCPKETTMAFEDAADDEQKSVKQCLQNVIGTDYCKIGGCLGRAWSLPEILTDTMENHDEPNYSGIHWKTIITVGAVGEMVSMLFKNNDNTPWNSIYLDRLNVKPADRDKVYAKLLAEFTGRRELARTLFAS